LDWTTDGQYKRRQLVRWFIGVLGMGVSQRTLHQQRDRDDQGHSHNHDVSALQRHLSPENLQRTSDKKVLTPAKGE
jgi:hypothetical protein